MTKEQFAVAARKAYVLHARGCKPVRCQGAGLRPPADPRLPLGLVARRAAGTAACPGAENAQPYGAAALTSRWNPSARLNLHEARRQRVHPRSDDYRAGRESCTLRRLWSGCSVLWHFRKVRCRGIIRNPSRTDRIDPSRAEILALWRGDFRRASEGNFWKNWIARGLDYVAGRAGAVAGVVEACAVG
jgi:hypothetical protein